MFTPIFPQSQEKIEYHIVSFGIVRDCWWDEVWLHCSRGHALRVIPVAQLGHLCWKHRRFGSIGPVPPNIPTTFTESHWTSQETLLQAVEMMDVITIPIVCLERGHTNRGSRCWTLPARTLGLSLSRLDGHLPTGCENCLFSCHDRRG